MKNIAAIIVFSFLFLFSCQDDNSLPAKGYEEVTLKNLTGLDGCGYLLQKSDNTYLEPVNLGSFINSFTEGKKYLIRYEPEHNMGSICMAGEIIRITELKER